MTTKLVNHLYYLVCLIVAVYATVPASAIQVIPSQFRPYVVGAVAVAAWFKANWNLFVNPDGTAASTPYTPPAPPASK